MIFRPLISEWIKKASNVWVDFAGKRLVPDREQGVFTCKVKKR